MKRVLESTGVAWPSAGKGTGVLVEIEQVRPRLWQIRDVDSGWIGYAATQTAAAEIVQRFGWRLQRRVDESSKLAEGFVPEDGYHHE
jgi:hypothetical protein